MVCAEDEYPFVTTLTSSLCCRDLLLDLRDGTRGLPLFHTAPGSYVRGMSGDKPPSPSLRSTERRAFVLDGELKLRGWLEGGGFVLMSWVAPSPARAALRGWPLVP